MHATAEAQRVSWHDARWSIAEISEEYHAGDRSERSIRRRRRGRRRWQASASAAAGSAMATMRRRARAAASATQRRQRLGGERARARRRRAHERAQHGEQRRQHAADVLVAHGAEHERHVRSSRSRADRRRARARRPGCAPHRAARRRRATRSALQPAGPARTRQAGAHRRAVEAHSRAATSSIRQKATAALSIWCRPGSAERARRRADVRRPRARPSSRRPPRAGHRSDAHALGGVDQPRAALAARRLDHGACAGGDRSDDDRYPRLDDAGLLARDRLQGLSQQLLVIEVDRGDGGGHRSYDVGRVQAAAQADLEHGDLDRGARNSSKAIAVAHSKNVGSAASVPSRDQRVRRLAGPRRRGLEVARSPPRVRR